MKVVTENEERKRMKLMHLTQAEEYLRNAEHWLNSVDQADPHQVQSWLTVVDNNIKLAKAQIITAKIYSTTNWDLNKEIL